MNRKKTMWFEVKEGEKVEDCLKRMATAGYTVAGKREEPLFQEVDGEVIPIRQIIKFKGILTES
ncbi:NETI motif-containing protein [Sporosarcina ureilytica]|uniref:NETI motif-containing protein n=1 Tax=Sporosarcina ureilytica TaxID=298596 RepID=A0A1D8JDI0_9BACL|nr:NETI motif-containing protein [Sporosarcina ureilytica]AOV06754.1 hypothetical protein BI350_03560 [Sporosarcina ureilytica]